MQNQQITRGQTARNYGMSKNVDTTQLNLLNSSLLFLSNYLLYYLACRTVTQVTGGVC